MEVKVITASKHNGEILGATIRAPAGGNKETAEMLACKALAGAIGSHLAGLTTETAGIVEGPLDPLIQEAALFTEWLLLGEVEISDPVVIRYRQKLRTTLLDLLDNPHAYRSDPAAKIKAPTIVAP